MGVVAVGAEVKQHPDFFDAEVEVAKVMADQERLVVDPVELSDVCHGQAFDPVQALVLVPEKGLVDSNEHFAGPVVTGGRGSRVA